MFLFYMGAGILPTTIYNNKIYFLFGKENKYEDSAEGFSDFGGGTDNTESYLSTAIREGGEELTGFLGSSSDIKKILKKHGTYNIDYKSGLFIGHIFEGKRIKPLLDLNGNKVGFTQIKLLKNKRKLYKNNVNIVITNDYVYYNNTIIGNIEYIYEVPLPCQTDDSLEQIKIIDYQCKFIESKDENLNYEIFVNLINFRMVHDKFYWS